MKSILLLFLVFVGASTLWDQSLSTPSPPVHRHDGTDISNLTELNVQTGLEIPAHGRLELEKKEESREVMIIDRCRAQELSPGAALGIMVVLATACAVHMPGSMVIPKRGGLYRL